MRKKLNNKGFTIVEVIIAALILGIISAPLLGAITRASRINKQARKIASATTMAETYMESFNAYPLEDIARLFNNYAVDESGFAFRISMITGDQAFEAVKSEDKFIKCDNTINKPSVSPSFSISYDGEGNRIETVKSTTFKGQDAEEYSFVVIGAQAEDSLDKFDVVVKLKMDSDKELAAINSMGSENCGYYIEQATEKDSVVGDYWMAYQNTLAGGIATYDKEDLAEKITQTITVDIKTTDLGNQTATVTHLYTMESGIVAISDRYQTTTSTVFSNFVSGVELKAVYVYYYPLYSSSLTRDFLVVNNETGENVIVYFVSMAGTNFTAINDANYRASLTINNSDNGVNVTEPITTICSNVKKEKFLTTISEIKDLGNRSNTDIKFKIETIIYNHNESSLIGDTFTPKKSDYILSLTGSVLDNSNIERRGS